MSCSRPGSGASATGSPRSSSPLPGGATKRAKRGGERRRSSNACSHRPPAPRKGRNACYIAGASPNISPSRVATAKSPSSIHRAVEQRLARVELARGDAEEVGHAGGDRQLRVVGPARAGARACAPSTVTTHDLTSPVGAQVVLDVAREALRLVGPEALRHAAEEHAQARVRADRALQAPVVASRARRRRRPARRSSRRRWPQRSAPRRRPPRSRSESEAPAPRAPAAGRESSGAIT